MHDSELRIKNQFAFDFSDLRSNANFYATWPESARREEIDRGLRQ